MSRVENEKGLCACISYIHIASCHSQSSIWQRQRKINTQIVYSNKILCIADTCTLCCAANNIYINENTCTLLSVWGDSD